MPKKAQKTDYIGLIPTKLITQWPGESNSQCGVCKGAVWLHMCHSRSFSISVALWPLGLST